MILWPVLLLVVTRRSFEEYGLTLKGWRASVDAGLKAYLARLVPWVLGYAIILRLGSSYVGLALGRLDMALVSTVVWQFLFSGFGEEMIYRGYIQSRVNQEYGRPWQLMGVQFGPGLIAGAAAFGLSHVLNTYNPFVGQYSLSWWWGLWTFFAGCFYGFIREKTRSVLAVGIAHGLPDAVGEGFAMLLGWKI